MTEPTTELNFLCRDCSNKQCYECLQEENTYLLDRLEQYEKQTGFTASIDLLMGENAKVLKLLEASELERNAAIQSAVVSEERALKAEQERDELDERRDELLVVIADKDREAEAARRTGSMWKDELIEANKQIEAAEETSNDWRILAHNLELILRTKEATIKEISELPEKWRYHGDGECNCLTCVCANELQASLNRSKS